MPFLPRPRAPVETIETTANKKPRAAKQPPERQPRDQIQLSAAKSREATSKKINLATESPIKGRVKPVRLQGGRAEAVLKYREREDNAAGAAVSRALSK